MARQKVNDAVTADIHAAIGLDVAESVDRAAETAGSAPADSSDPPAEAQPATATQPPAVRSGDNCPTGCGAHISVLTRHRIGAKVVEYLGCRRCGFLPQAKQVRAG